MVWMIRIELLCNEPQHLESPRPFGPPGTAGGSPGGLTDRKGERRSAVPRRRKPRGSHRLPRPARAATPREDTERSEERGSNDALRLLSLREIEDFPLAVRTRRVLTTLPDCVRQAARIHRILATSRESSALSNDSESWSGRAPRELSRSLPQVSRRHHDPTHTHPVPTAPFVPCHEVCDSFYDTLTAPRRRRGRSRRSPPRSRAGRRRRPPRAGPPTGGGRGWSRRGTRCRRRSR